MPGDITEEQVNYFMDQVMFCDEEYDEIRRLALLALRQQQEGMVVVPRSLLKRALARGFDDGTPGCGFVASKTEKEAAELSRLFNELLAASERDQRGAAAASRKEDRSSDSSRQSESTSNEPQSAPHHDKALNADVLWGIALGIEAAAKWHEERAAERLAEQENCQSLGWFETASVHAYFRATHADSAGYFRSLQPAEVLAKNPTDGQEQVQGLNHKTGEIPQVVASANQLAHRLGAEEARRLVREKYPNAWAGEWMRHCWGVWADDKIHDNKLGSGPTEDAAWLDVAARL